MSSAKGMKLKRSASPPAPPSSSANSGLSTAQLRFEDFSRLVPRTTATWSDTASARASAEIATCRVMR
eukprot:403331-Prorocentrum_minimum.AAC.1